MNINDYGDNDLFEHPNMDNVNSCKANPPVSLSLSVSYK